MSHIPKRDNIISKKKDEHRRNWTNISADENVPEQIIQYNPKGRRDGVKPWERTD
jgi:hypothetical protein